MVRKRNKMNKNNPVTKRIIELCKQQHMSLAMLQRSAKLSDSTFNAILNGQHKHYKFRPFLKICKSLGVSMGEFYNSDLLAGNITRQPIEQTKEKS